MNINVKCPYCGEETVIELDGHCEACGAPLGFPAVGKDQEEEILGKIYTVDRPESEISE